jgi:hypothetical protein
MEPFEHFLLWLSSGIETKHKTKKVFLLLGNCMESFKTDKTERLQRES